MMKWLDPRAAL